MVELMEALQTRMLYAVKAVPTSFASSHVRVQQLANEVTCVACSAERWLNVLNMCSLTPGPHTGMAMLLFYHKSPATCFSCCCAEAVTGLGTILMVDCLFCCSSSIAVTLDMSYVCPSVCHVPDVLLGVA